MNLLKKKTKGSSLPGVLRAILFLLLVLFTGSVFALPAGGEGNCCAARVQPEGTVASACCAAMPCCRVQKDNAPKPLQAPVSASSRSFFKVLPAMHRLAPGEFLFATAPFRFSRGAYPPSRPAPLARGCIQLI